MTTNLIACEPLSYRKTSEITCRITRPVFQEGPPIADLFETHLIINVANDYKVLIFITID